MQNLAHVKRARGNEYFEKEIANVPTSICPTLSRLKAEVENIDDMHAVRMGKRHS